MDDEFDKLMDFFALEIKEREKRLEEIFQRSMEFFDKYKYILSTGSEEQKADIQKKMVLLREKIKQENEKAQKESGLTPEEIKQISANSKNFTAKQWEFLQKSKEALAKETEEREERRRSEKEQRQKELREKATKKKPTNKKSSWMKS